MGGELLERMGFRHRLLGEWQGAVSSAADTRLAIERLQEAGVALILFAGGDGTARDVAGVVREQQPVLGIPAGVKIHSGVYAISPRAAGELARRLVEGGLVRLASGEVRDLDEEALRAGRVAARWYGEMTVPEEGHFMQREAGRDGVRGAGAGGPRRLAGGKLGRRRALCARTGLDLAWPGAQPRPGNHPAGRRRAGEWRGDCPRRRRGAAVRTGGRSSGVPAGHRHRRPGPT